MTEPIPAAPPHPFATHIPDRHPQLKTHKGVGQAKNALIGKLYGGTARHDMTIYRLDGAEYKPWVTIMRGQTREDVPELATKPKPKSHLEWEIRRAADSETYHREQADAAAKTRRELEAQR